LTKSKGSGKVLEDAGFSNVTPDGKFLYKLFEEYVEYYNKDRTHYSLDKDPPSGRPVLKRNLDEDKVIALPRVGGLHHKYVRKDVA
jgi:hypothetical protein